MFRFIFLTCIFSIFLDLGTTYVALTYYPHIFTEGNTYISCIYTGCGATHFVTLFFFFRIVIAILVKNLATIDEIKIALLVLWATPGLIGGLANAIKLFSM